MAIYDHAEIEKYKNRNNAVWPSRMLTLNKPPNN